MNQHISEKQLIAYINDELKPAEHKSIQEHIAVCSQCLNYVNQMQAVYFRLEKLASPADNQALKAETLALFQMLKRSKSASKDHFAFFKIKPIQKALTFGAIAAGLAIGLLFGNTVHRGLLNDNMVMQKPAIVLQENDQTIYDTYVSLIVDEGRLNP